MTTIRPPSGRSAPALVEQARGMLREAERQGESGERFRLAHLAALRGTAALFAERARPAGKRRLVSAWVLVDAVAPELSEWSAYFAGTAAKRAAVEAGARGVVSDRDATDQLRAADQFLALVEQSLGLLATPLAS
ncbi:MAG TPA: SAV_6107 family HEPN domain-containing protein [Jatrophihabitantaceae bacterium]